MFYYFKYFWFIAWNWGFRLAFFTIYHEIRGEKKYRIDTAQIQDVNRIAVKGENLAHAEMYQGASYFLLEKVFGFMKQANANSSLIDFGAGKGRALIVAAAYEYKNIIGIEFAETLCREAKINIDGVKKLYPSTSFEVIHADVVNYKIPDSVTNFFFFNPFDEVIMKAVLRNILISHKINKRTLYVIYVNPVHKEVFLKSGFKKIAGWKKLTFIEAEIYQSDF